MKKAFFAVTMLITYATIISAQNVGIGTNTPAASAGGRVITD